MNQILGINETISHRKELGDGRYQVPDGVVLSIWPEPTQSSWQINPGVYILPNKPADIWPKLDSAQLSSSHVQPDTLVLQNTRKFLTICQMEHFDHVSLLLLDQNSNHWHQTYQFYWTNCLTVSIVTKEIKRRSKTQEFDVLESDIPVQQVFYRADHRSGVHCRPWRAFWLWVRFG